MTTAKTPIPPPPRISSLDNLWQVHKWLVLVKKGLDFGSIDWDLIDFTNADLADITRRLHNDLQERDADGSHPWNSLDRETTLDKLPWTISPTHEATAEGEQQWNEEDHCPEYVTGIGNRVQIGQEVWGVGVNKTGGTATDGKVVYASGVQGNRLSYQYADARDKNKVSLVGVVTSPTDNNQEGPITVFGFVRGLDTSSFSEGTKLYIAADATGTLTDTAPSAPNFRIWVATVTNSHPTQGSIFVDPRIDYGDGITLSSLDVLNSITAGATITATGVITGDPVVGELYSEGDGLITAGTVTLTTGTAVSGSVSNTHSINQTYYQVAEIAAAPAFEIDFDFTLTEHPGALVFVGRYQGSPAHNVVVQAYNYTAAAWQSFTGATSDIASSSTDAEFIFNYDDLFANNSSVATDYLSSGNTRIRFAHTSTGNITHNFYIDYLTIQQRQYTVTTGGAYVNIDSLTEGFENNTTLSGTNGTITIIEPGNYKVTTGLSFSGSSGTVFNFHAFKNGIKQDNIGMSRQLNGTGDVGAGPVGGYLQNLVATDVITLRFTADEPNKYINIENINFSIERVN